MKPVVVGVDGSDDALKAVRWSAAEAVIRHRPLSIVHCSLLVDTVYYPAHRQPEVIHELNRRAEGVLARAATEARAVAPHLEVTTTARAVLAIPGLLTASQEAEIVILGARGVSAFKQLVLGSTSRTVAARATCPVVIVGAAPTAAHRRIVVGVDGSDISLSAVEFAFEEASWRDAVLVTVHACGFPHELHDLSGTLREHLQALDVDDRLAVQETLAGRHELHPDVKVEELFVHDQPTAALVALSESSDLVVVGSQGRSATKSLLLGSVAHAVLRHAVSPVAVVHG
jgi:nucleotide-binding universal stress UspA family protein